MSAKCFTAPFRSRNFPTELIVCNSEGFSPSRKEKPIFCLPVSQVQTPPFRKSPDPAAVLPLRFNMVKISVIIFRYKKIQPDIFMFLQKMYSSTCRISFTAQHRHTALSFIISDSFAFSRCTRKKPDNTKGCQ